MLARRVLVAVSLLVGATACSDDTDEEASAGSRDEFCAELRTVIEEGLTIFDPEHPVSSEETQAATRRLADAAPAEVQAAMRLLADTFVAVTEVLDELSPSHPETAERLAALDIDPTEVATSQEEVTGYALDECRIDLEAINAASVTTATTPGTGPTTVAPSTVPPTTVPPVAGP